MRVSRDWVGVILPCAIAMVIAAAGGTAYYRRTARVVEGEWRSALAVTAGGGAQRLAAWRERHVRETQLAAQLVATASRRAEAGRLVAAAGNVLGEVSLVKGDTTSFSVLLVGRNDLTIAARARAGEYGWLERRSSLRRDADELLPRTPRDVHQRQFPTTAAYSMIAVDHRIIALSTRMSDTVMVVDSASAPPTWIAAVSAREMFEEERGVLVVGIGTARRIGAVVSVSEWEQLSGLPELGQKVAVVGVAVVAIVFGVSMISRHARRLAERRRAAEAGRAEAEGRLARAELEALKTQLRPHFLFNALNTIAGLVDEDPTAARRVVEGLSTLLRVFLSGTVTQEVTVDYETQVLRSYVAIQETRFGERLRIRFDVDPEAEQALVPLMITQPLVENAIQHGVGARRGAGNITVSIERRGRMVVIRVLDDGIGVPDRLEREGIGLRSIRVRLMALYGQDAGVVLRRRQPQGTEACVTLPLVMGTSQ